MADWQRTLDIVTIMKRRQGEEITIAEAAIQIAKKLGKLCDFGDEDVDGEKHDIVEQFNDIANGHEEESDFRYILGVLYDWADTKLDDSWPPKKVCWIKPF